ncbi:MAG: OsmC family protein [Armatimonadetes bacterium]|nr:OsmC family protein [Armatimonadota bacterium]
MKIEVTAKNVGPTVFSADIRGTEIKADVPPELGGTGTAPLPPEIFLAALAECFGMVAALHCKDRGIPYEGMTVTASAEKAEEDGEQYWTNFKLHVHFPEALPDERVQAILRHATQACSVRGTIKRAVDVEVTAASGKSGCCCCGG